MNECDETEMTAKIIDNHDEVGEPRDSEEVKDLVDAIKDDNPMNESDDLGDGTNIVADEIEKHDEVGEPRDSEEVKNLVDQIKDDNVM